MREKYMGVFREILANPEDLSAEQVRDKILEAKGRKGSSKMQNNELVYITQILREKIQEYTDKRLNRNNYQQILFVLNIAGWLEDRIEKKGVRTCISAFNTAQILDCPLRGSVSARFAYHKNKYLRKVARSTYAFTNREDPFRYIEGEHDFLFMPNDAPSMHDMLVYRNDNELLMPNFMDWIKLDQPNNLFRLFCIDEILFFKRTECCEELYAYMLKEPDSAVKARAIRTLGKLGYTQMEEKAYSMFNSSQGELRLSILVGIRELGLKTSRVVEFFKNAYKQARREKEAMTALDALYNCSEEGRLAFIELQNKASQKEKMRFAHICNPLTNDRAYEK
ncbi:MAG: HEAT repeat domain-containing protein [Bacteroidaceae bacterium]|nr:HEAT repeat domain-containing protein [Bacteroidaceae bacterium]